MVRRKNDLVGEINEQINSQKYVFNERTSVIWKGKLLTFYKKWEDRFVDFCLYRHLNELALDRGSISPNYVSSKGRGRIYAVKALRQKIKKYGYIYKTDVKSYFASMNTVRLESIIYKEGIPSPLHYLIWQDLFQGVETSPSFKFGRGIFQGSFLSSFYAWIYLKSLDDIFSKDKNSYYQRYKDDIIDLIEDKKISVPKKKSHLSNITEK